MTFLFSWCNLDLFSNHLSYTDTFQHPVKPQWIKSSLILYFVSFNILFHSEMSTLQDGMLFLVMALSWHLTEALLMCSGMAGGADTRSGESLWNTCPVCWVSGACSSTGRPLPCRCDKEPFLWPVHWHALFPTRRSAAQIYNTLQTERPAQSQHSAGGQSSFRNMFLTQTPLVHNLYTTSITSFPFTYSAYYLYIQLKMFSMFVG